jgi:hypothetical protein
VPPAFHRQGSKSAASPRFDPATYDAWYEALVEDGWSPGSDHDRPPQHQARAAAGAVALRMARQEVVDRRWLVVIKDGGVAVMVALAVALTWIWSGRLASVPVAAAGVVAAMAVVLIAQGLARLARSVMVPAARYPPRDLPRDPVLVAVASVLIAVCEGEGLRLVSTASISRWDLDAVRRVVSAPDPLRTACGWGVVLIGAGVLGAVLWLYLFAAAVVRGSVLRFREVHDLVAGVADRLVRALEVLDAGPEALASLPAKVKLIWLLDGAAENLEVLVRRTLRLAGPVEAEALARWGAGVAGRLRGWSLDVALADLETGQRLGAEIRRLIGVVVSGQYGRYTGAAEPVRVAARRPGRSVLRELLVAVTPLGVVLGVRWVQGAGAAGSASEGGFDDALLIFAVTWAVLSLLLVIDSGVERKLTMMKTFWESIPLIRTARGQQPTGAAGTATPSGAAAGGVTASSPETGRAALWP